LQYIREYAQSDIQCYTHENKAWPFFIPTL
jgi:hypothetical protein